MKRVKTVSLLCKSNRFRHSTPVPSERIVSAYEKAVRASAEARHEWTQEHSKRLALKLKECMAETGLTFSEVRKRTGISHNVLKAYLNNTYTCSIQVQYLWSFAQCFGKDITEFL